MTIWQRTGKDDRYEAGRKHYGDAENEQADSFYRDSADAQSVYQFAV